MIAIRSSCIRWLERSPILPRAVPLLVFVGLTYFQGKFGEASRYWFYLAKTLVGAWFILMVRPLVPEMRWRLSWEAVAMGILVFVMWIGLDDCAGWLGLKSSWINWNQAAGGWNPHDEFGLDSGLAWGFIGMRILGSTWVVPPLEEVFYRSFLYRYLVQADFLQVPLGRFLWLPFLLTSMIFGSTHNEWLAGLLAGLAFQGLVCWTKRLGDAMTAHAITNFLLGLWVIWQGAWHFW